MSSADEPISPWREFTFAAVFVALAFYGATPGAGFLLPFLVFFALAWFVRLAWVAWRQPPRRRAQAIKVGAIVVALAIALFLQARHQRESRAQAQHVVDAVLAYRAQHGSWPDDLAQAGLDAQALRDDWGVVYTNRGELHRVSSSGSLSVRGAWVYDFDKPGWVYDAD